VSIDLETLREIFRRTPFMADLGVEPVEVADGRVVTQLTIAPRHLQHTGVVHAGVMVALADHSMGAAAQTLAPAGQWVLTAEIKASLLRAGRGQRLECVATVLKPGRQLSFTEAEVFAIDGASRSLVLKASATMGFVAGAA
jgi:uncharacterized protein (TIGR00369 family)